MPAATAATGIAPQLKPQTGQLDKESAEAADFARRDLAQKLAVGDSAVAVITFEDIVWRDGSLGCPLPDMMYTQGMVDGYVMQLRVGDEIYNYHGANGRDPFLCDLDVIGRDSAVPSLRSGALATPPGGQ